MYSNPSNQFIALVKGEYGKTPVPVDPEFRLKIAGTREEIGVRLAENEKEVLLLELFPMMAHNFLSKKKQKQAHTTT